MNERHDRFEKWARDYFGLPAEQSWQMILNGGAGGTVVRQITIAHLAWQAALSPAPPAPQDGNIVEPAMNALSREALVDLRQQITKRIAELDGVVSPAGTGQPCTCCSDMAEASAAFADASRANNHDEERKHRERYIEILAKHVTGHGGDSVKGEGETA